MYNLLILGSNSYLGNALKDYLEQFPQDYSVSMMSQRNEDWEKIAFVGFDSIIDFVGIAHVDNGKLSKKRERLYYTINKDLAVAAAEKAKREGVKQFIFISSAIIYGKQQHITADTLPVPESAYGDSKWQAEQALRKLDDSEYHIAIIRPPMIYGPDCKGNYPKLVRFAQKSPIFPYISNKRSMLYVETFCEFLRLLIKNGDNGIFWPQNEKYVCTSEMVKTIAEMHNKRIVLVHGTTQLINLFKKFGKFFNKVFGDFYYDQNLSAYKDNYQVCDFKESIRRTEKIEYYHR